MSKTRIPEAIAEFDAYINNTAKYLPSISSGIIRNWERLGLSQQNADDWKSKQVFWRDDLFPRYSSPLQSTSVVKEEVRNFMKNFRIFGNPLLNIMVASPNATAADERAFRFKIKKAKPTHTGTQIEGVVSFSAAQIGGGELAFSCRANKDGRASLAKGANCIQMAFCITDVANNPLLQKDGKRLHEPEDDDMKTKIFTRTHFIMQAGPENVGKGIVVFLRWYNTRHPLLAGSWSAIAFFVIA